MHYFETAVTGMPSGRRKWKWSIGVGILLACILLWNPLSHVIFEVRFALSLQKLAAGDSGQDLAVRLSKIHRPFNGQNYEALVYYPTKSPPTKAVLLIAGLSELGCYHPRLMALSRFLADRGLMVLSPDIREFRDFQISPKPIDQILFWYGQISTLQGGGNIKKTGLAGISYSGTIALICAANPEIRDQVGFVIAVGPYSSLIRCTRNWFAASPGKAVSKYYPTRYYAKWIIMLSALDMVADPEDRLFLHGVLDCLLLQHEVPPARAVLTAEGARWYRLATMHEDRSDPELVSEIEKHLTPRIYAQLDPGEALNDIRCPVFLIHGAYDDLIPPEESMELHRKISDSHLLIIPFLTHTHPTDTPISRKQKLKAGLDALFFCYQLSRVIQ
jgi:pimeloyl-ACP methyl ester carboxylesterase